MYSNKKSELELLKERVAELEKQKENSEFEVRDYSLPVDTLPQLMMYEKLQENWENLTLGDIEAICKI